MAGGEKIKAEQQKKHATINQNTSVKMSSSD
jgi:hypothetical protein